MPEEYPVVDVHVPEPAVNAFEAHRASEDLRVEKEALDRITAKLSNFEQLVMSSTASVAAKADAGRAASKAGFLASKVMPVDS